MKNISIELFLNEVAGLIDQKEEIRVQEMGTLIMKWKRLLESFRQSCKSQADEYRDWYYLKLSVEWIKESLTIEKKSPFLICLYF